jgi:hypothetical protein
MTLQYFSYRAAIEVLPNLLPSLNLDTFSTLAKEAFPHMERLSDNKSLTSIDYIGEHDSLLSNTFFSMMTEYDATDDLTAAIGNHSNELDEIASHLIAIADAWKGAGLELGEALSEDSLPVIPIILLTTAGVLALIIIVSRRRLR